MENPEESKHYRHEISAECDAGYDQTVPTATRRAFGLPMPGDRETDFGRWHIKLEQETHVYTVTKIGTDTEVPGPWLSVTTFAKNLFPEFDKVGTANRLAYRPPHHRGMSAQAIMKNWDDNSITRRCLGTQLHSVMELVLGRRMPYECDFAVPAPSPMCGHPRHLGAADNKVIVPDSQVYAVLQHLASRNLVPIRVEQGVCLPDLKLAGTVDVFFRDAGTGLLHIYDWKRYPDFTTYGKYDDYGLPGTAVQGLAKCDQLIAAIQLNLYRKMWELEMAQRVAELHIIAMHPKRTKFEDYPIPIDESLTMQLLAQRKGELSMVGQ
jgi:hypothetical protein